MFNDIEGIQTSIMVFVKEWVHSQNTPIPRKEIIRGMVERGNNSYTTINAIHSLIIKGYLRRAYSEKQNQALYVMIRNI